MFILETVEHRRESVSSMLICNRSGSKEPKWKSYVGHGRGDGMDPLVLLGGWILVLTPTAMLF